MSIPPLVCSTPPPPDQCEDDKDPDDFVLHYNLSQDEEYDYGNFSTYNHFQSAISDKKPQENTNEKSINDTEDISTNHEDKKVIVNQSIDSLNWENAQSEKKLCNEDDLNIEDLNLTVDEESSVSPIKNNNDEDSDSDKVDSSDPENQLNIEGTPSVPQVDDNISPIETNEIIVDTASLNDVEEIEPSIEQPPENKLQESVEQIEYESIYDSNSVLDVKNTTESDELKENSSEQDNNVEDDFGDFNDFSYINTDNKTTTIVDECHNPWDNDNTSNSEFGAFKANFDEIENLKHSSEDTIQSNNFTNEMDIKSNDEDDDFGDFDDFKSSAIETRSVKDLEDPLSQSHVPVLNFQTPESESQALESINKILCSIFEEEITEPETMFDGKLEPFLSETWGHLLETDVRQPYMVNWNSSIGQKTLLKALCIDSRNILFGPKWSYNMPKYAANLSAAPLQPQKQSTPSANTSEVNTDKSNNKTSGTWADPFTSDGQESCNKENETTTPKRPTELNVFDASVASKSDKIYSTSLGVQPLRQINLPDTHIFTPTDSETPRSKTIHYDNGPTVFLSQTSITNGSKSTGEFSSEPQSNEDIKSADTDYSDFQDFKSSSNVTFPVSEPKAVDTPSNLLPSTSITYQTGILQPIKIEPIMPTLNWPQPGEIKDTFDDFSDFISNSSWNNENQPPTRADVGQDLKTNVKDFVGDNALKLNEDEINPVSDNFDDDFDTFQSALPSAVPATNESSTSKIKNISIDAFNQTVAPNSVPNKESDLNFTFSTLDNVTADISTTSRAHDILKESNLSVFQSPSESLPRPAEPPMTFPAPQTSSTQITPNVLQSIVNTSQTQHNTGQILQPLSLESYSQINWPNPGINLQDLSRFNPVETLHSLKSDLSVGGHSKNASPVHNSKSSNQNQTQEDDIWGDFVSSKPKPQQTLPKKASSFVDDDEWTDFVSSPSVKPPNGLNTISFNVHTNLNLQKSSKQNKFSVQNNQSLDIPTLNYITPKASNHNSYNDRHFQNL